jgi:putative thiamine transport system permease protein
VAETLRALSADAVLRFAPALTLALFLVPIGAGLIGTALPALDIFPAIGRRTLSLAPWHDLAATPGIGQSVVLTIKVGFVATLASLALAIGFCALASGSRLFARMEAGLAPILATPHVAVAIGLAFLIAPSGWLVRLVSPGLTGWSQPPALATVRDPGGLSFALGLVLKETPYLILMIVAAAGQTSAPRMLAAARSLGYARPTAWLKVVFPQVYRQIRLPVYAVLAFSLSVVEVALILAPGTPPPLSVLAMRWFSGYDLDLYPKAAAAAILQLGLVAGSIAVWRLGENAVAQLGRGWVAAGARRGWTLPVLTVLGWTSLLSAGLTGAALASLAVWSLSKEWWFPDALPTRWTLMNWARIGAVWDPLVATIAIGAATSAIAVVLTLACLENEQRRGLRPGSGALWLLYVPLLVPQIAFLFGAQVVLVRIGLDATMAAVIWAHLLFALPYVFLSLADPFRALDPRYARIAAGLGASPGATFWTVKVPILLRPIAVAAAIGFAVSAGLYLPTLFAGAGRIATLTTEAITLSAGADRRLVGVAALLQGGLPLLVFAFALSVPALLHRRRRNLR